jgi:hypothetical protein
VWRSNFRNAIGGAVGAAVLGEIWRPSLEKRVEGYLAALASRIVEIADRMNALEERLESDTVVTCVTLGAQASLVSDEEKIQYLADAVANVIVDEAWEHDEAATLLRMISTLTASHIRILAMVDDPDAWEHKTGVQIRAVEHSAGNSYRVADAVLDAIGRAGVDPNPLRVVVQDLEGRGLLMEVGFASSEDLLEFLHLAPATLARTLVRFVTWNPPVPK